MPKTITIDVDKLRGVIASKSLGSGTAAYVCRISNNDWIRITGRGWGFEDEVKLMIEHLGDKSFVVERLDEVLSALYVKATINAADDPEELALEYFAEEMAQDSPRGRLLKWFKSQFGLKPEDLEDLPSEEPDSVEEEPDFRDVEDLSIPKIKAEIEGCPTEEGSRADAEQYFAAELKREKPRSTLLAWFKEEYGLDPKE